MTVLTNRKFFCKNPDCSHTTFIENFSFLKHKAKALNIDGINSFINGISRDIEAVKNAIIYDYNNGLAEGKINKIKVTKRIMYDRCGFQLLKEKSLRLEFQVQIN